jgi:hypothetical protein
LRRLLPQEELPDNCPVIHLGGKQHRQEKKFFGNRVAESCERGNQDDFFYCFCSRLKPPPFRRVAFC